jgi:hypothetical protein
MTALEFIMALENQFPALVNDFIYEEVSLEGLEESEATYNPWEVYDEINETV